MSRRRPLLVLLLAAALPAAAAAQPPTTSYHWAQPGCAPVVTACAQPPSWVLAYQPVSYGMSDYNWVQPGTFAESPGAQPPSWIPIG